MDSAPSRQLLAAIERHRKGLWGLCYRMTGSRQDADDLSQEAIARAIEREAGLAHREGLEGWLFRVATTVCLDHLRHRKVERRVTDLIDPIEDPNLLPFAWTGPDPETAAIRRDDLRFALVAALQWLPARQRAALVLHEVFGRPIGEVAGMLEIKPNAAKALLHRARVQLEKARRRGDVDPVADRGVVERLALAIESRSPEAFAALLDEDVWGVIDGGGLVRAATKPVFGPRALTRMWVNVGRRVPEPMPAHLRTLNGEPAIVITLPASGGRVWGTLHLETRNGRIAALRVIRDPRRLTWIQEAGLPGGTA